ncbi:MAG: hypothetical protein IPK82_00875 [Polyangiaceae bacterium]|nr:hypothetical protein [Polyangiaceae bacterium]
MQKQIWGAGFLFLTIALGACGGESDTGGSGGQGGSGQGASAGNGGENSGGSGGTSASTGGATTGAGATGGGDANALPPVEKNTLFTWLKEGHYLDWKAESGPHPSAGPHGGKVRTYFNSTLDSSFAAGNSQHPKDSATVKKLYGSGTSITGWAVMRKTSEDTTAGQGWYWYEVFSVESGQNPVAAGNGVSLCVNCHKTGGVDMVLTPYPLQ